jgi:rhodanese-related sulfurtransferase
MRNFFLKLTIIFLLFSCNQTANLIFQDINSDELELMINKEDLTLLDVRTTAEYSNGHLISAVNINYYGENFDDEIDRLDKLKPIVVYCKSGGRSSKSALKLVEKGFKKIYNLKGGFDQWVFNGKAIQN